MENFDFGKAINIFLVAFVIFIVVMIAFVARLVSTFMVRNKNTNITSTYATSLPPAESPLEIAHSTTVNLTRISDNYLHTDGKVKEETYDVMLTIAEARKQALNELFAVEPAALLSVIFPEETRTLLPQEAQSLIEVQIITEGKLLIIQVPEKAEKKYTLIARNGEEYTLYFPDGMPQLSSNIGVRIHGVRLDNKILVQSIEQISI